MVCDRREASACLIMLSAKQRLRKPDSFPAVSLVESKLCLDSLYHKAISTAVKSDDKDQSYTRMCLNSGS